MLASPNVAAGRANLSRRIKEPCWGTPLLSTSCAIFASCCKPTSHNRLGIYSEPISDWVWDINSTACVIPAPLRSRLGGNVGGSAAAGSKEPPASEAGSVHVLCDGAKVLWPGALPSAVHGGSAQGARQAALLLAHCTLLRRFLRRQKTTFRWLLRRLEQISGPARKRLECWKSHRSTLRPHPGNGGLSTARPR